MEELVKKAKQGNTDAFTELILNLQEDLFRIARLRLQNDYDIDEAVQETMISAFKSIKKLQNNQYFKTWIIKILINKCNKIYTKKQRYKSISGNYNLNNYEALKITSNTELDLDFFSLIELLNYQERITMVLFYVYGYKIKDISKILHKNENTIKTWLSRGKEKIRNHGGLKNG